jgi:hypothetical protein
MFADVIDQDTVRITLRGQVPVSPDVTAWLDAHGARQTNLRIEFDVRRGSQGEIAGLATAIRAITLKPPYKVKSYKHVCPRVGSALDRVRAVLEKAWL